MDRIDVRFANGQRGREILKDISEKGLFPKRTAPTRLLLPVALALSPRILAATPIKGVTSSFDHVVLPSGREEATDRAEVDPAVAILVDVLLSGNAALRGL